METKTFTSASASKFIKSLENEKELLLSREAENSTYVRAQGEVEEPPEYDYAATRAAVDQIDEKVRRIRHAQHAFNATAEVPGEGMTVDEALVALAQMNAKLAVLARLRSAQVKKRVGQGWGNTQGVIEYEYANYDVERAAADYAELFQRIANMQLNIDLVNQTQTFEVEL